MHMPATCHETAFQCPLSAQCSGCTVAASYAPNNAAQQLGRSTTSFRAPLPYQAHTSADITAPSTGSSQGLQQSPAAACYNVSPRVYSFPHLQVPRVDVHADPGHRHVRAAPHPHPVAPTRHQPRKPAGRVAYHLLHNTHTSDKCSMGMCANSRVLCFMNSAGVIPNRGQYQTLDSLWS